MSNNSRLEIKRIITTIKNRYESAGITQLNILQRKLDILAPKKDSWTQEEKEDFEGTTMEALMLQASLQGAFSMCDTLLKELGFVDLESALDKNTESINDISGDNGVIKYTVSSTPSTPSPINNN